MSSHLPRGGVAAGHRREVARHSPRSRRRPRVRSRRRGRAASARPPASRPRTPGARRGGGGRARAVRGPAGWKRPPSGRSTPTPRATATRPPAACWRRTRRTCRSSWTRWWPSSPTAASTSCATSHPIIGIDRGARRRICSRSCIPGRRPPASRSCTSSSTAGSPADALAALEDAVRACWPRRSRGGRLRGDARARRRAGGAGRAAPAASTRRTPTRRRPSCAGWPRTGRSCSARASTRCATGCSRSCPARAWG